MDGYSSQAQSADRSRPPPFPRTASRSSTSSTRTRLSNNSSSTSSQQAATGYGQRFSNNRPVRTPTTDRPRSQLSREASDDTRQPVAQMSTFLQERLERERRVESERSSSRASDRMSGSVELRPNQGSPTKGGSVDGRRPQSSNGSEPAAKKKSLGFKEMEKTLSTLHKQNFDLKLELYHRREKQTALEERLESVESDKAQIEQINDQLIEELEKRDKAVEEAVAMIVVLEARVEQLLREREIVRRFEEDGMFYSRSTTPGPVSTPKMKPLELPKFEDVKDLNRMPSFLSEHSENTENLRNVYLGRGSVVSLPPTAEDTQDTPQTERTERINSPTLSMLSESSFMSIYGKRHSGSSPPPNDSSPLSFDGSAAKNRLSPTYDSSPRLNDATPSRPRQASGSRGVGSGQGQFQNITGVLELGQSPLQRLERLEMTLTAMSNASRPSTSYQEKDRSISRPATTLPQLRTKQEKRQALEKVMTQGHLGREMPNHHCLPPTPDTISTTTLRRYRNSNDTLSGDLTLTNERSYLALSETTTSQVSGMEGKEVAPDPANRTPHPPSVTAFDSRRQLPESNKDTSQYRRPRSASDSTVSQQRRDEWGSDGSDVEFPNPTESQTSSFDPWLRESLKPQDLGNDGLDPSNSASQAGLAKDNGRISPDLFSFPTTADGWATNAMFGSSLGVPGYKHNDLLTTPMADTLDAIGRSLPTPLFGSGLVNPPTGARDAPPPAPNRRSSLHARTGSQTAILSSGSIPPSPARPSPITSKITKRSPARTSRRRSNSTDVFPAPPTPTDPLRDINRSATVPPKQLHLPPPPAPDPPPSQALPKQRHYPPTSSQAPRGRGLNNLFRRSTGSADSIQAAVPSTSSPPTETTATFGNGTLPSVMSTVGVPWVKRNSLLGGTSAAAGGLEDERASATPPPIMRNKAGGGHRSRMSDGLGDGDGGVRLDHGGVSVGGGAPIGVIPGRESSRHGYGSKPGSAGGDGALLNQENAIPATSISASSTTGTVNSGGGGGKLRWLGIGRRGSVRKSGGGGAVTGGS